MPSYHCRYVSDGVTRSCRLSAGSAAEAAEKMRRISWAPGCGPVGTPRRDMSDLPLAEAAASLLVAAAIAASSALVVQAGPERIASLALETASFPATN